MGRGLDGCGEGWAVGFRVVVGVRGRDRESVGERKEKFRGRWGVRAIHVRAWRMDACCLKGEVSSQFSELERGRGQRKRLSRCWVLCRRIQRSERSHRGLEWLRCGL